MLAIFSYNFDESVKNFEVNKCKLYTLSNYNVLLDTAVKTNYISEKDVDSLNQWRENPKTWDITSK